MQLERVFTDEYFRTHGSFFADVIRGNDNLKWVNEDIKLIDTDGNIIFEQDGVEFPEFYSLNAMTIIASKFFRGDSFSKDREFSLRQIVERVVTAIAEYGLEQGYFDNEQSDIFEDELSWIIVYQMAWFNSPVWFNIGVEGNSNQASACFILNLDDTMESIMDVANQEAFIFKEGSGTGKNLSNLRANGERLSMGGKASGVLSFMHIYNSIANIVKAGGKCLAPYQKVYTERGAIAVSELAESGEDFVVLSYDPPASRYKAKKARAWKSGRKKVVRITTDKGVFDVSEDHPVKLSDGSMRIANNLKEGNSLFQCVVTKPNSYQRAYSYKGKEQSHRVIKVKELCVMDVYSVEVDCLTPDDKSSASGHNYVLWSNDSKDNLVGNGIVVFNSRRAAKLEVLDVDHPEIMDFIKSKSREEDKARALMEAGYGDPDSIQNEAYDTVAFQSSNISISIPEEFISAIENDTTWETKFRRPDLNPNTKPPCYPAREVLHEAAKATHNCGDPGYFFEDTVNDWNPCQHKFRIRSGNPCFPGYMLVDTASGRIPIEKLAQMSSEELPYVFAFDITTQLPVLKPIIKVWETKTVKQLIRVTTRKGLVLDCTPDHKFLLKNNKYVEASKLTKGTRLRKIGRAVNEHRDNRRYINHRVTKKAKSGTEFQARWVWEQIFGEIPNGYVVHHKNSDPTDDRIENLELQPVYKHQSYHSSGENNPRFIQISESKLIEIWEAIENLRSVTKTKVTYTLWNKYIHDNNLTGIVPLANHRGIRGMSWNDFTIWIKENREIVNDTVETIEYIDLEMPVKVYDMTVADTHNFAVTNETDTGRHTIIVSNCMEFLSVDNSACNLASLNLTKFETTIGDFDLNTFSQAVTIMIIAQDILVSLAGYPTEEITKNSNEYRPLGLGYGNLGGLLASLGIPYDSDEGRTIAASITSLMTAVAYNISARIANKLEAYTHYNEEEHYRVIQKHYDAWTKLPKKLFSVAVNDLWTALLDNKPKLRNSQVTLLAPTGTIGFAMDLASTGVEPLMGIVIYKKLSGGGSLKLTSDVVKYGLFALGYSKVQIDEISEYITEHDTIEGAPNVEDNEKVFDCAYCTHASKRFIEPDGHLLMLAAVQPFLSGGISKTIALQKEATVEDIENIVLKAHKLGLKAVSIYRDGSKGVQPLDTGSKKRITDKKNLPDFFRKRMPPTRPGIIHKLSVGEQEVYLSIGLYEDGSVGEIFINAARTGSTINGLLDVIATLTSIALQYGVPLHVLVNKFRFTRFEPSGITNNPKIRFAGSIIDYIFTYLEQEFVNDEVDTKTEKFTIEEAIQHIREITESSKEKPDAKPKTTKKTTKLLKSGAVCPSCGLPTLEITGSCKTCRNCGHNSGCG